MQIKIRIKLFLVVSWATKLATNLKFTHKLKIDWHFIIKFYGVNTSISCLYFRLSERVL